MPERRSPKSSRSSKSARPAARSTSRAKPARPTSRPARPARARVEPEEPTYDGYDDDDEEQAPRSARPVAVGGGAYDDDEGETTETVGDVDEDARAIGEDDGAPVDTLGVPPAPSDGTPVIERPRDEMLAGIASLLIAASVFLPWFHGTFSSITGWSSGNLGPIVFFLGVAGAAIVGLRRAGVTVTFPLEHSLILEGIGWVTVLAILIKRFKPPHSQFGTAAGQSWTIFLTMALGIGLAFAGGRSSATAPFVIKPGWFTAKGGKLGVGIIASALALGVIFGFVVTGSSNASPVGNPTSSQPKLVHGLPHCATAAKFPVAAGATAVQGYEPVATNSYCVAIFSSKLSVATLLAREVVVLKAAGWKTKVLKAAQATGTNSVTLSGPKCGSVIFAGNKKQTSMTVYFGGCAKSLKP